MYIKTGGGPFLKMTQDEFTELMEPVVTDVDVDGNMADRQNHCVLCSLFNLRTGITSLDNWLINGFKKKIPGRGDDGLPFDQILALIIEYEAKIVEYVDRHPDSGLVDRDLGTSTMYLYKLSHSPDYRKMLEYLGIPDGVFSQKEKTAITTNKGLSPSVKYKIMKLFSDRNIKIFGYQNPEVTDDEITHLETVVDNIFTQIGKGLLTIGAFHFQYRDFNGKILDSGGHAILFYRGAKTGSYNIIEVQAGSIHGQDKEHSQLYQGREQVIGYFKPKLYAGSSRNPEPVLKITTAICLFTHGLILNRPRSSSPVRGHVDPELAAEEARHPLPAMPRQLSISNDYQIGDLVVYLPTRQIVTILEKRFHHEYQIQLDEPDVDADGSDLVKIINDDQLVPISEYFNIDSRVMINGLLKPSVKKYNGQEGTITSYFKDKNRLGVKIRWDGNDKTLQVRPQNLRKL